MTTQEEQAKAKQKEFMKFMNEEIIHPLKEENQNLKHRISSLEEDAVESHEVVRLYKSLLNKGFIYVNTCDTDCDGVSSQYSHKFTDIEEYFRAKKHYRELEFEGSSSWSVVSERQVLSEEEQGSFGHGWGIN